MVRNRAALILLTIAAVLYMPAMRADNVTIDLTPYVNSDLNGYTDGWNFPTSGPLTVDGIPFDLAGIGGNQDTGIIQTNGSAFDSIDIPIGVFGVTSAYALVNSAWGACGATVGEIDFVGSAGTYVYALTEGNNIRDHFEGGYCNTVTDVAATANFGPDRLDMDTITLPAAFAGETLETIEFVGYGLGETGSPFLTGLTLDPDPTSGAPEPSTVLFLAFAAILMALLGRTR
jgi:hypothetical protein